MFSWQRNNQPNRINIKGIKNENGALGIK